MTRLFSALLPIKFTNRHPVGTSLQLLFGCLVWLSSIATLTPKALTAEQIYVRYSAFERTISVAALETYAKEGKINDDLAYVSRYVKPQNLAQLRRVLLARIDLSPVAVAQFLYTPQGTILLQRLGEVIQTEARQPGFYAIRSALILAAATPDGLTLLNVIRQFPTRSIRINLSRSLRIAQELDNLINRTNQAATFVNQQARITAASQPVVNLAQLPDLRQRGKYRWSKQTLKLFDRRRDRLFIADIYLPRVSTPAPVIVISHGLGSDRTSFAYLATQLASYGFAVAVPEHPGSNAEQLRSLLSGRAGEVARPNEFINRPLDVKYLLDQLQILQQQDSDYNLNLQQVGVIGQSFGGYTALALAGANLNFQELRTQCQQLNESWNASLLLQCRALELPDVQYNLRDRRIKAVIAINPFMSSVFGESSIKQIQTPVMIVSSSTDTIAPALPEQIQPFTWLNTQQKYLVILNGATHFSTIGEVDPATEPFTLPAQAIGVNPEIARQYMQMLSVAFFETYLANAPQYRLYLNENYAQVISQSALSLSLVKSLPANEFTK